VALSLGLSALLLGQRVFARIVHRDVEALLAHSCADPQTLVTDTMLEGLPDPVRRYLRYTGVVGKPLARTVHLKQHGAMRPNAEGAWMPLDAEQFYSVQPPGFVWSGTVQLGPLPLASARDRYADGKGSMLIRAGGIYPIVDAIGEEMDQGGLMRYLSEMVWFPSAFLGPNISFAPIDDRSARVTLTDHGRSVEGVLHVDEEGRVTDFVAQRNRMVGGRFELATWSTPMTEYGEFGGLKLPMRVKAIWKLLDGDLPYFDIAITELEYDVADDTGMARRAEQAA
jgi:hypothetical protein